MNVMIPLSHLNDARVEEAPRAVLGFIVQQLSGDGGVRVGHVSDGCSAERAGVLWGDRMVNVEGTPVATRDEVLAILNGKAPGELLTIDVTRDGQPLQFGFVLGGEAERPSDVARLEEPVRAVGQELACVVTVNLPPGKHIYSMSRRGFGVPTHLEFRGRGYELVGESGEPETSPAEGRKGTPPDVDSRGKGGVHPAHPGDRGGDLPARPPGLRPGVRRRTVPRVPGRGGRRRSGDELQRVPGAL